MYFFLALVVFAVFFAIGYAVGRAQCDDARTAEKPPAAPPAVTVALLSAVPAMPSPPPTPAEDRSIAEHARIMRSLESETAGLRRAIAARDAALTQLRAFAADRERLYGELAQSKTDTARYRQLVIDIETNAPPPLLGSPGAPDDLKLIVGVGPILERMLYQLGITTYRQIARWSERDIDDIDARLSEFPGRIRRDGWVTQARALYQSKYGEPVPVRDRA